MSIRIGCLEVGPLAGHVVHICVAVAVDQSDRSPVYMAVPQCGRCDCVEEFDDPRTLATFLHFAGVFPADIKSEVPATFKDEPIILFRKQYHVRGLYNEEVGLLYDILKSL